MAVAVRAAEAAGKEKEAVAMVGVAAARVTEVRGRAAVAKAEVAVDMATEAVAMVPAEAARVALAAEGALPAEGAGRSACPRA